MSRRQPHFEGCDRVDRGSFVPILVLAETPKQPCQKNREVANNYSNTDLGRIESVVGIPEDVKCLPQCGQGVPLHPCARRRCKSRGPQSQLLQAHSMRRRSSRVSVGSQEGSHRITNGEVRILG